MNVQRSEAEALQNDTAMKLQLFMLYTLHMILFIQLYWIVNKILFVTYFIKFVLKAPTFRIW
jgi:hypothetical protein